MEVVMQAVRTIVDSGKLDNIITLPPYFHHKKVEVIIQLIPSENKTTASDNMVESESFGMWEDRQDMNDVEAYVRNLRKGRKLC
jgi:hypothetical protein